MQLIPFSAFWLRSSVVSVLISLISDMWPCVHCDIKFIFCGEGPTTLACQWGPHALPRRCTAAWAWRTPTK
uniref:Secreted protein n=1 Tax=Oryza brachyantha TaxID=4533 RepID=J3LIB6_ORYBR